VSTYAEPAAALSPLEQALHELSSASQNQQYRHYCKYYDGIHDLRFATLKFRSVFGNLFKEFAENMCPAVVDSLNERLKITGFESSAAELKEEQVPVPFPGAPAHTRITQVDPFGESLWDIWGRNNMDVKSTEVHQESLKEGDSYVIVWPDSDMKATIWPQVAEECRVHYDPNNEGIVLQGEKGWFDTSTRRWRLNIYLPDRIDKYQLKRKTMQFSSRESSWEQIGSVPNPYGEVAMFHFPNKFTHCYGVSELKDVVALQDALNKSVMDMLIAMEFASFKQRYVIGMEVDIDPITGEPTDQNAKNYGVDRLMTIPDENAKVGQFDATDLKQFLEVQEKFWTSCAKVTGTPLHYFLITKGDFPSGEAMKSAEARFTNRIQDRQVQFGSVWEKVMMFAALIDGVEVPVDPEDDFSLTTQWTPAVPRSEAEIADAAVKKKSIGVSRSELLRDLGYDEDTIQMILAEADAYEAWNAELRTTKVTETGTLGADGKLVDPTKTTPSGNATQNPRTATGGTSGVRQ